MEISNFGKMKWSNSNAIWLAVSLDREARQPLHAQLARHLRRFILQKRLAPGERLPASRVLAEELSVSRGTITSAFDQLVSEGYIDGRPGSGVYVAKDIPDYNLSVQIDPTGRRKNPGPAAPIRPRPFETAVPDLNGFPHREWARLLEQSWREPDAAKFAKPDPFGWGPLREAIASHLGEWRGIRCSPTQIIITTGMSGSIELITQTTLQVGDLVLTEDPGFPPLRNALQSNGMKCAAVPVDQLGFNLRSVTNRTLRRARAIAITPSRQFPLGMTLPLPRRLELLEWASERNGYIIEDDFDSEYRYQGQPLPALMALDDRQRVIYVGSFSKVLLPTLRLGFVVMPEELIDAAAARVGRAANHASMIAQPALAEFMRAGGFATHVRRMRRLYSGRQKTFLKSLQANAGDLLLAEPASGGMHLVVTMASKLTKRMSDIEASTRAAKAGVTATALSTYFEGPLTQEGLVLGYAGYEDTAIEEAVGQLAKALRQRTR